MLAQQEVPLVQPVTRGMQIEVYLQKRRQLLLTALSGDFSIGSSPRCTFIAPDLLPCLIVFESPRADEPWRLNFTDDMEGFVCQPDANLHIPDARKIAKPHPNQKGWTLELRDVLSGSIRLGSYRILFLSGDGSSLPVRA